GMFDLGDAVDKGQNPFAGEEIELVKAIAAQATALIDRMRRNAERENLHKAAQAMSRFFDLGDVLQSIVTSVKGALGADSVAILPYDEGIDRFIPEELAAANIPYEELVLFKEEEPEPGRTARAIMQEGWVGVGDIHGAEVGFIGRRTREMLSSIKARSFQGVALSVGSEAVGVLYVNYRYPRKFGEEDRRCLDNLAKYAALSLKKARLLDHVKKTERAAQIVAKVMALGDLDITMFSIANGTKEAIDCDAVVLYTFDPISNSFNSPVTVGVNYPNRVSGYRDMPNSLVYQMLRLGEPYKAEKVSTDPLFKGRRFALDERIKSCLAIPLKAVDHEVGVMFVNYHRQHRFTADELTSIELFANQAAVAIRNAHLFQERTRKLLEQGKLGELSKGLLSIEGSRDVLDLAASAVRDLIGPDGCEIILREKNKGRFFTARLVTSGGFVDAQGASQNEASQANTGFTFKESSSPASNDWPIPRTLSWNGLEYGMSVPMEIAGELVGIISLYTTECRSYTDTEVTLLSIIANQASIAIKTAEQYEAIKRQSASLDALYRAGKAITASFGSGRKQVLDRIVEQAVECLKVGKGLAIAFGTIQLYNDETDELHFESACSREYTEVFAKLGEVRPVKGLKKGHKPGIAGRTILTRAPQLVRDVTKDQDYVEFDPRMKSALCVPLLDQGRVLGVLGLESDKENAFDMADVSTLQALAELAVIAIRNAQQYDDLKNTRVLAESRTALAWMGMTSSTWRHMIHGHAITIKDLVELAVSDLNKNSLREVREKLLDISDLAMLIQQHPITAPLSSEEGVRSILVNALLQERMGQLWEPGAYKSVELRFDFRLPSAATVRANPDWLNRALSVLVDNAIDAMKTSGEKILSVTSRAVGRVAQVEIKDTGNGIPPHILGRVLQKPIEHPKGIKKLGLGLLMARLIVQVYGGDIRCEQTGPAGTTMVLSLPLEA
ncbi:MAG TPA: GAF domain-containing protein, partial [Blastocatellia bacterium]